MSTVKDFEAGKRTPINSTLGAMRTALETEGIVFSGEGEPPGISYKERPA